MEDVKAEKLEKGYKIHGFLENKSSQNDYIILMIEREENQIQFVRIYFWGEDNTLEFISYRDCFPRT